ncbi:MAG: class I SAM-dependent methyltransferase [Myxococcota bacterium]
MAELNLMKKLPRPKRAVATRLQKKTQEAIEISRLFGREYFDGPRSYGYGGYHYDGRWIPVAEDIVEHYQLGPGSRVLDVGCAKGFLVKDLMAVCPGLEAFGLDISEYAILNCEPEVIGRLHLGSCDHLPFPDHSFDAVIAKDVIHNLDRAGCLEAVREIERIAPGRGFIQVDSYRSEQEKTAFLDWVLTAKTHYDPAGWRKLFEEAGFTGDYHWTIIG